MSIGFPASSPVLESMASSATRMRWSSRCAAAEKNALRRVWPAAPGLLRSAAPAGARPLLRRQAGLPRVLDPPGRLQAVSRREARGAGVAGRQPPVHRAVRVLRRPAVPGGYRRGHRRGARPRLGDRQGAGQAVHAGATPPGRQPRAAGHRHRRDRRRPGPPLSDRGQRPGAGAADLVRRPRPLRGEPGRVLRLARPQEMPQGPRGRHGHVEGVPQLHPQGRATPRRPGSSTTSSTS